ncbi:MAG: hypothetical protein KF799_11845, partial [Bdellovibrionales bacterium]|nr:hypothetical protein [Bdellovibrionales bacterium]
MNLKNLSDQVLLEKTSELAYRERSTLIELLHHLREIERRRLFCTLKYQSLHDYMMKHLKYSDDEAVRRISAMRLLKELPAEEVARVEEKISEGELTLTNLSMAQTLFNHERKAGRALDAEDKAEFLRKIENQTTREAQKTAQSVSPEFRAKKKLGFSDIEDDLLREKLLRIKGQYAHKHPDMDLMQLLHLLCDHELAPVAQRVRKNTTKAKAENKAGTKNKTEAKNKTATKAKAEIEIKAEVKTKAGAETMSETKKAQNNDRP